MPLTLILCVPLLAGLLGLGLRRRVAWEWLNIMSFMMLLILGMKLLKRMPDNHGVVAEWNEFLRADALSAWMVLLISIVSLATSIYAVHYFRRDLANGQITERRIREFYVLTPLFAAGMLLVVLARHGATTRSPFDGPGLHPGGRWLRDQGGPGPNAYVAARRA